MKRCMFLAVILVFIQVFLYSQDFYTNKDIKKFNKPHLRINPIPKRIKRGKLVISGWFSSDIKEIRIYREMKIGLTKTIKVIHKGNRFTAILEFKHKGLYIVEIGCVHKKWAWKMGLLMYISVESNKSVTSLPYSTKTYIRNSTHGERLFLKKLNELRRRYNLPALKSDAKLVYIARLHSRICSAHNFSAHNTPWDGSPKDRAKKIGYHGVGENISGGRTVERAINGLFRSIAHRMSILSPTYTKVGIGVARFKTSYMITINFLNEGHHYLKLKNYSKALAIMKAQKNIIENSIWKSHKQTATRIYSQLGWLYFKMKNYIKAKESFLKAYKIDNQKRNIVLGLGYSLYKTKDYIRAIKLFKGLLKINPQDDSALKGIRSGYLTMAYSFYKLNNYDQAIENYKRVFITHPNDLNALKMIGWSYYKKNEYNEALIYFNKALKVKQRDKNVLNGIRASFTQIAYNYYKEQNYDDAIKNYKRVFITHPNYLNALKMIGWCYYKKNEYNMALNYFKKALKVKPRDENSLKGIKASFSRIAYNYYKEKQYDNAIRYFNKVIRRFPNDISALRMLGWIYYRKNNFSTAKRYFIKALRIKPDDTNAQKGLEACNRRMN